MEERPEQGACECWFLDVGQGTSNVILLGEGKAIVIDVGPNRTRQTIQLLRQQYVDTLEAMIISHNDSDHDGNVGQVLEEYRKAVKRIFFLQDRAISGSKMPRTLAVLRSGAPGDFPDPERLEVKAGQVEKLFSQKGVDLSILYPDMKSNLGAQASGKPNQTSAVLRLSCAGRRVVFSADATVQAWEYLATRLSEDKPLVCDVMTVPHHGGSVSDTAHAAAAWQHRLYNNLVKPQYAIVSVGTLNPYGHPDPEVIQALRDAGVKVLCTQMTEQCCGDLEMVRQSRRGFVEPSRSRRERNVKKSSKKSSHVACFGSVVAEISGGRLTISSLRQFEQDMATLSELQGFSPLCRS